MINKKILMIILSISFVLIFSPLICTTYNINHFFSTLINIISSISSGLFASAFISIIIESIHDKINNIKTIQQKKFIFTDLKNDIIFLITQETYYFSKFLTSELRNHQKKVIQKRDSLKNILDILKTETKNLLNWLKNVTQNESELFDYLTEKQNRKLPFQERKETLMTLPVCLYNRIIQDIECLQNNKDIYYFNDIITDDQYNEILIFKNRIDSIKKEMETGTFDLVAEKKHLLFLDINLFFNILKIDENRDLDYQIVIENN